MPLYYHDGSLCQHIRAIKSINRTTVNSEGTFNTALFPSLPANFQNRYNKFSAMWFSVDPQLGLVTTIPFHLPSQVIVIYRLLVPQFEMAVNLMSKQMKILTNSLSSSFHNFLRLAEFSSPNSHSASSRKVKNLAF